MIDIESFRKEFPLAQHWGDAQIFRDDFKLGELSLQLCGLHVQGTAGLPITASAASVEDPMLRCYFELLERTSIIDAENSSQTELPLRSLSGEPIGLAARSRVFPESPNPERWKYSKSNGVAAHVEWARAVASAEAELVERDRILRSWFASTHVPQRIPCNPVIALESLGAFYEIEAYAFPAVVEERFEAHEVVGIFGFPKGAAAPCVYGFGSRPSLIEALDAASLEFCQRLGFLWGEALPQEEPLVVATPLSHQEYFLHSTGIAALRSWLAGTHRQNASDTPLADAPREDVVFVDLTPAHLAGRAVVVKAVAGNRWPLWFGPRSHFDGKVLEWPIHPIA